MNLYTGHIIKEIMSLDDQLKIFDINISYIYDYFKKGKVKSKNVEELRNELLTDFEIIKKDFESLNGKLNWIICQMSIDERRGLLK